MRCLPRSLACATGADYDRRKAEPERELTKDEMLGDISLYWFTGTGTSSARLYWENNAAAFRSLR